MLSLAVLLVGATSASAHHYDELLAPTSHCRTQTAPTAPVADQERAMRCLHNHTRSRRGLPSLRGSSLLQSSAGCKAADIMRCQDFSHYACDRDAFYWPRRVGYARGCWGGGENIAWAAARAARRGA
jgi:uncharacterized protein YkwD